MNYNVKCQEIEEKAEQITKNLKYEAWMMKDEWMQPKHTGNEFLDEERNLILHYVFKCIKDKRRTKNETQIGETIARMSRAHKRPPLDTFHSYAQFHAF